MTTESEPVPPEREEHSRAMVVFAHPDDADWGCSGTVAKWTRLGWEVVYVMCTDGSKGTEDRSLSGTQLSQIRKQEQTDAGRVLGLKSIEFLDFPDGYLEPTITLRREIVRVIRKHQPHILITTNPTRDLSHSNHIGHPDHFAAGEAALSAVFPSARDHLWDESLLGQGLEPWKVHEVWVMMFGEGSSHWNPLEEEDIEKAIGAIKSHVSQLDQPENVDKWMRRWRAENGKNIEAPFAEASNVFNLSPASRLTMTTRNRKTRTSSPEPAITNTCQPSLHQNPEPTNSHRRRKATAPANNARARTLRTPSALMTNP